MTKAEKRIWAYRVEDVLCLLSHMGLRADDEVFRLYNELLERVQEIQGDGYYKMRLVRVPWD